MVVPFLAPFMVFSWLLVVLSGKPISDISVSFLLAGSRVVEDGKVSCASWLLFRSTSVPERIGAPHILGTLVHGVE